MAVLTERDREDAFGPRYGIGAMFGSGFGLVLLLNVLFAGLMGADIPAAALGCLAAACIAIVAWMAHVVVQRRIRLRILREGVRCEGLVTDKVEEVYNGFGAAAQPLFWLTVRYEVSGATYTSKQRVTDRVYLQASAGRKTPVRVLPDRPELWVPDGFGGSAS